MDDKPFWARYFKTYDILNEAIPYQRLVADFFECLDIHEGDLILDAGSGTGNFCIRLRERGAIPIGFDFSERALEIHRRKDPSAIRYLGDLTEKLPFPNDSFDKIISNNVLYTIDKKLRLFVVQEWFRVLKPEGKIVIANVHTDFNPFIIFMDHFRQTYKINGPKKTTSDLFNKGLLVAKMFYYSYCLIKKTTIGKYAFLEKSEQRHLLQQAGFRNISETVKTYSGQSYLDVGIK
jgi:ubiquinone/menaquinone biosynthesis C-methylase UbiE